MLDWMWTLTLSALSARQLCVLLCMSQFTCFFAVVFCKLVMTVIMDVSWTSVAGKGQVRSVGGVHSMNEGSVVVTLMVSTTSW
jgi:hypothetical protein